MADPRITPTNPNLRRGMSSSGQSGQPAASRSSNPGQTAQTVGQMSSYGVARSGIGQIRHGDIVRGEISDLRNNEITITLENNTVLRGQIADSSSLSIGQTAAFRLSATGPSSLLMEVIPNSYTETELTMINKALEEAGLPSTERNQSAVKALMDNLMPINKQSIQQLMQQAYDLGTEDMESLCLMNRQRIPVTADSAAQFSAYRHATHQLLGRVQTFATQLPQLLGALSENGPSDAVASFGQKLLSIALSTPSAEYTPLTESAPSANQTQLPSLPISQLSLADQDSLRAILARTPLTEQQLNSLQDGTMSQREALPLIQNAISSDTAVLPQDCPKQEALAKSEELLQALQPQNTAQAEQADEQLLTLQNTLQLDTEEQNAQTSSAQETMPSDASELQAQDNPSLSDADDTNPAARENNSAFTLAGRLFHNLSDAAKNSIQNINQNINQMLTAPQEGSSSVTHTPAVIDSLLNNVTESGREHGALFTFLSAPERTTLTAALEELPISSALKENILSGEATAKEVFQAIHNAIPQSDSNAVQQLFQSEVFQKLFTQTMMENLTVTPKQLAKNGEMDSFYEGMSSQMDSFEKLINATLSGNDSQQLSQQAHDTKSNIDFMKALNDAFGYMQLPLKLRNQNAHGDLYVYTKKEKLKQNTEQISLLLHLEMEHLGNIDVRLEKDYQNIKANFKLDNEDALELVSRNTHMLQDSLQEKGYTCQIQVQPLEKPETPVQDFLNKKVTTAATREMKRYSFDIRA